MAAITSFFGFLLKLLAFFLIILDGISLCIEAYTVGFQHFGINELLLLLELLLFILFIIFYWYSKITEDSKFRKVLAVIFLFMSLFLGVIRIKTYAGYFLKFMTQLLFHF